MGSGPFADLDKKTDQDLLDSVASMNRDNPIAVHVERVLQVRNAQRQVDAGVALVRATQNLATATWVLAGVTVFLLLTSLIQAYLAYEGVR